LDPLASLIIEKIQEKVDLHVNYLSTGGAENYSDYAGICGVIKGMNDCIMEIKDIDSKSSSNEDF
jgi:hypothetical protein